MHIPRSELREILQHALRFHQLSEDITGWRWKDLDYVICWYLIKCTEDSRYEIFREASVIEPDKLYGMTLDGIRHIKKEIHKYLRPVIEIPIAEILTELKAEARKHEEAEHHEYRLES